MLLIEHGDEIFFGFGKIQKVKWDTVRVLILFKLEKGTKRRTIGDCISDYIQSAE